MTTATVAKTETKTKSLPIIKEAKTNKKAEVVYGHFSSVYEYDVKKDAMTISVLRRVKKTDETGKKETVNFSLKSLLPSFESAMKIKDGKEKRKSAIKAVKELQNKLKTNAVRSHLLVPMFYEINLHFKKDYSSLLQASFRPRVK